MLGTNIEFNDPGLRRLSFKCTISCTMSRVSKASFIIQLTSLKQDTKEPLNYKLQKLSADKIKPSKQNFTVFKHTHMYLFDEY